MDRPKTIPAFQILNTCEKCTETRSACIMHMQTHFSILFSASIRRKHYCLVTGHIQVQINLYS